MIDSFDNIKEIVNNFEDIEFTYRRNWEFKNRTCFLKYIEKIDEGNEYVDPSDYLIC